MKRNFKNPFWDCNTPVAIRKELLNDLHPDYDVWRRYTDVESSGECEEVFILYKGCNIRILHVLLQKRVKLLNEH